MVGAALVTGGACGTEPPPPGSCQRPNPAATLQSAPIVLGQDHVMGSSNAPVTVFEYADFQCPFCAKFEQEIYPIIKANYIDTGKVRWVFRHFPLRNIHANAQQAARASECFHSQNSAKFWDYKTALFNSNYNSSTDMANHLSIANLKALAGQVGGIDQTQFDTCVDDTNSFSGRIQSDVDSGTQLFGSIPGSGTPAFIVAKDVYFGALSASQFSQILDCAIAAAGG
jgi:protein-disulfide isomerase